MKNEDCGTSRTHQGTAVLHHLAPMLTGVFPGNGLFIIAGCTFLFLFCASKKEKEKKIFLPTFCLDAKSGKKIKANLMRYTPKANLSPAKFANETSLFMEQLITNPLLRDFCKSCRRCVFA